MFLFEWIRPKAEKLNYLKGQDTTDFKGVSPPPLLKILNEHVFLYIIYMYNYFKYFEIEYIEIESN